MKFFKNNKTLITGLSAMSTFLFSGSIIYYKDNMSKKVCHQNVIQNVVSRDLTNAVKNHRLIVGVGSPLMDISGSTDKETLDK